VHILYFEAADLRAYRTLFQQAEQLAGEINLVLVAVGGVGGFFKNYAVVPAVLTETV